jgi:hypothetical protein
MLRTVIYVPEPSTLQIQTKGKEDSLLLFHFPKGRCTVAPGPHHFDRGVYLMLSNGEVDVSGANANAVALPNTKDIPPVPQLQQIQLAAGLKTEDLARFINVVGGIEVPGDAAGDSSAGEGAGDDDGAEPSDDETGDD